MLLVDAARGIDRDTRRIFDRLAEREPRVDPRVEQDRSGPPREASSALADTLSREGRFDPVFMISGLKGDGVEDAEAASRRQRAARALGCFPEDQLSDAPERLIAAEVTREQVFLQLRDGAPLRLDRRNRAMGGQRRTAACGSSR